MKLERNRLHEILGDWFVELNKEKLNTVVEVRTIAFKIRDIKKKQINVDENVTKTMFTGWICRTRKYLELERGCTLHYVTDVGYKIADKEETAMYAARAIRYTLLYAGRTTRLFPITDKKYLPAALRKVFMSQKPRVKTLRADGQEFLDAFKDFVRQDQQRKEIGDASKKEEKRTKKKR